MDRLTAMPVKLGDAADIFVGLQTSADTVFLFKEWESISLKTTRGFSKELQEWVELESAVLKPVVRSGAIGRYWGRPEARVLFPYEFIAGKAVLIPEGRLSKLYPKAWVYLNRSKNLLASREHEKFKTTGWYQLYPKNLDVWERPKLLVPYMVTRLSAFLDTDDLYFVNVTTGGFGIVSKECNLGLEYLCGLLNSQLLDFYLKRVSTNFRGGYFAANKQFIGQLPICPSTSPSQPIRPATTAWLNLWSRCWACTGGWLTPRRLMRRLPLSVRSLPPISRSTAWSTTCTA